MVRAFGAFPNGTPSFRYCGSLFGYICCGSICGFINHRKSFLEPVEDPLLSFEVDYIKKRFLALGMQKSIEAQFKSSESMNPESVE